MEPEAESRTVEKCRIFKYRLISKIKTSGNKGFTLIELVVAIAIMSMVMIAAAGLIVSASNSYRLSNIEIELQMEAQTAMNQLNDILIEAKQYAVQKNGGITEQLVVWTAEKQYIFRLDKENRRLVFRSAEQNALPGGDAPGTEALLAKYCDSFSVTPETRPAEGEAQLVTITLTFVYADKIYETTSCISLRGETAGDIVSLNGKERNRP